MSNFSTTANDTAITAKFAELEQRVARAETFRSTCYQMLMAIDRKIGALRRVHLEHAETCKLTAEYNRGDLTGQIIRLEKEVSRMMDDMDAHGIRRTETSGE